MSAFGAKCTKVVVQRNIFMDPSSCSVGPPSIVKIEYIPFFTFVQKTYTELILKQSESATDYKTNS